MRRYGLLAIAAAACITVAGCGSDNKDSGTQAGPTPAASSTTSGTGTTAGGISIKGFKFDGQLTVKAGEKVTVTNEDSVAHTLTDKGGKFDSGNIDGGGTGTFTAPSTPGSYELKCSYHPQMSGTLVVQ